MIWYDKELSIEKLKPLGRNTMAEYLGIEWVEVGKDFLKAKMPVDHRTIQPYGLLHGGASCVLAETVGSVGSAMVVDHSAFYCVGLEINANHIRGEGTRHRRQGTVNKRLNFFKNLVPCLLYLEPLCTLKSILQISHYFFVTGLMTSLSLIFVMTMPFSLTS